MHLSFVQVVQVLACRLDLQVELHSEDESRSLVPQLLHLFCKLDSLTLTVADDDQQERCIPSVFGNAPVKRLALNGVFFTPPAAQSAAAQLVSLELLSLKPGTWLPDLISSLPSLKALSVHKSRGAMATSTEQALQLSTALQPLHELHIGCGVGRCTACVLSDLCLLHAALVLPCT